MFLGIYDYTVILTYISLGISVFGITRALEGDFKVAIFCLALSGLCDMFDGKIARTKKNRTDDEKNFGIQIDSLCDVVCFGIFPAMICYCLGVNTPAGIGALIFYSVASVIRLAYFNVSEAKRQNETSENRQYYQGLPITSIAVILPLAYVTSSDHIHGDHPAVPLSDEKILRTLFPDRDTYCSDYRGTAFYSGYQGKKTSESGTYPAGCSRGTCTCEDVPFDIK